MALLELKNISKSFGKNVVLDGVDFQLESGEVHALLGENGAGKSTMLNIIGGLIGADGGEILINGEKIDNNTISKAKEMGIGFVHQEIELCQDVSVAENIMMASICDNKTWNVRYKDIEEEARKILEPLVGEEIRPEEMVSSLSISHQQVVEIAKAISCKCKILLLDEPTAALSESETASLFQIMHQLKQEGIGIVFISHRMAEIFEESDRVTVLRDGKVISTYLSKEAKMENLLKDMAGRAISDIYPPKAEHIDYSDENRILTVKDLTDKKDRFREIDFSLYRGEILGVAGLVGAGRTEIMQAVVNLRKRKSGDVIFLGKIINHLSTAQIYKMGLVLLSEDRKKSGLYMEYSIEMNISSTYLEEISKGPLINQEKERALADSKVKELAVKCSDLGQLAGTLSGGNQQKVLLAKLLAKEPKAIILDEPTRGVDAGAKAEIGKYIRELADRGIGVIIISSEMNELVGLCDRLMYIDIDGNQVKEEVDCPFDSDRIIYYISGAYKYEEEGQNDKE
ncbi:sugar ABC transporter ATP-binding protein [Schaedlerella sp.]|uniref:sugar ABC transporter ATP-binding protein n=1 Tax=Schaedlerella sp. TaxID=2676057 RepID=UPI0013641E5D|nr:sugar ABC transporter ATP-binding protein [Lachnospiraceae bacterium]